MAYSSKIPASAVGIFRNDSMHQLLGAYDIDVNFYDRLQRNRRVSDVTFYPLLVTYICQMIFGTLSNGLVIWVVAHQRSRRHLHQLLMINLALSDLLLCVLTMPLTFMEIVTFSWPLGNYPFLCRLTGCVQAISVYVSTLTIAAIALDRYHLIVHPTRDGLRALGGLSLVVFIWMVSIFSLKFKKTHFNGDFAIYLVFYVIISVIRVKFMILDKVIVACYCYHHIIVLKFITF